jgi:hypothetical protein
MCQADLKMSHTTVKTASLEMSATSHDRNALVQLDSVDD